VPDLGHRLGDLYGLHLGEGRTGPLGDLVRGEAIKAE
jgi:hypothetical protein